VTQTSPTGATEDAAPMFPPGRYGRRRDGRGRPGWVNALLIGTGVAILALFAVRLYLGYGNDSFSATVLRSSDITSHSMTVTLQVDKADGRAGSCIVQAFAFDQSQVGQATVHVPAGKSVKVTATIQTSQRPYIAQMGDCQPGD